MPLSCPLIQASTGRRAAYLAGGGLRGPKQSPKNMSYFRYYGLRVFEVRFRRYCERTAMSFAQSPRGCSIKPVNACLSLQHFEN
jgi:hypothetical protein